MWRGMFSPETRHILLQYTAPALAGALFALFLCIVPEVL